MRFTLLSLLLFACVSRAPEPGPELGAEADVDVDVDTDTDADVDTDEDGDGHGADEDCDDSDERTHPGADERCDGVDNDCDGEIDNDALDAETFYADTDGDGFGDLEQAVRACEPPVGWVPDATDCDDDDPASFPGAEEILRDGIDQDCDGEDQEHVVVGYREEWDGETYGGTAPGLCLLTRITLDVPLTITHIAAAVDVWDSSSLFHLMIYEDLGGEPGALLASVEDTSLVDGINELALASPLRASAGDIWAGICNDSYYENGTYAARGHTVLAYPGDSFSVPEPFHAWGTNNSVQFVVWVLGY